MFIRVKGRGGVSEEKLSCHSLSKKRPNLDLFLIFFQCFDLFGNFLRFGH